MTISFKELSGSPVEIFGSDGMKAQRRLLCAFEDRYAVVAALLGNGNLLGGAAQASYPGCPGVTAAQVRVEPFEKRPDDQGAFDDLTADLNSYSNQFVSVAVNYELGEGDNNRPKLPNPKSGTFLTYRMDFGGEYVAMPGNALRWQSDPTLPVPPDAAPTLRVPIAEHHVTWHRVTNPPWDAMRACAGTVNEADFMGAAAETVLFDGAKAERQFTGLGDLMRPQFGWKITYVFREKAIKVLQPNGGGTIYGWNHCYRSTLPSAAWDKLVDSGGNSLYRTADFNALFQFSL